MGRPKNAVYAQYGRMEVPTTDNYYWQVLPVRLVLRLLPHGMHWR